MSLYRGSYCFSKLISEDYEKRLAWYKEKIWTCQCTGHFNLTHEEAWNSEKNIKKTLKSQFPTCFEKDVLEIVHHSKSFTIYSVLLECIINSSSSWLKMIGKSTVPLDALVDQAWLKLQQVLSVGEKVNLKVKSGGKVIGGVITKVDPAGVEANPTSNCSSPSSDKENCSSEGNSPKKWVPPKLLPYKYSVQLEDGDKIINAIPAEDLLRNDKPPSKDLVRYFIRANALRTGATTPWIVEDHLVKKYSIPRKFADFLLSPVKRGSDKLAKE
ncbi:hypothetical protein KUTeg_023478 [Tegillarca granosa]|uniref:WAC domain-containing protein n=1 Tax=Tegillarca granosa TaxID=220873 RepID=A0ABQ9E1U5_TEGGR|nr:hypothetical protein KUTeg_023478 [Tegillarca granosa]